MSRMLGMPAQVPLSSPEASAHPISTSRSDRIAPPSEGVFFNFFYDDQLDESIVGGVQHTFSELQRVFARRVEHNDRCLELAQINRHSLDHTRRVTNAALQMAAVLGVSRDKMQALALAGVFHDVGYHFPEGVDPRKCGKETHHQHPKVGALNFVRELALIRNTNEHAREELDTFGSDHMNLAYDAILNHSNGSDYDEVAVPDEAKLLRLFDKTDNTCERVYPSHIMGYAAHLGVDTKRAWSEFCLNEKLLNSERRRTMVPAEAKRRTLTDVHERLEEIDPKYEHRVVPYVITHQMARLNSVSGEMLLHYRVDPSRLSRVLQTECLPEEFVSLFNRAYGQTSMRYAAGVMHSVRNRVMKIPTSPNEKTLKVVFDFPTKKHFEQLVYKPVFTTSPVPTYE